MQTVQTLGADCADFGCRLCSSGPGMFFLGADCADFWVQTVQHRARNVFFGCRLCSSGPGMNGLACRLCSSGPGKILGADLRADFGCRLCRLARDPESWRKMKYQDNQSDSDDVEIHLIRLLL